MNETQTLAFTANEGFDPKVTKRPTREDKDVRATAADKTAKKVMIWTEEEEPFTDDKEKDYFREKVIKFLIDESRFHDDGFKLAKAMEDRLYCDADSSLVEILDDASHHMYLAEESAQEKWVKDNGIQLTVPVDGKIAYTTKSRFGSKSERLEGTVSSRYEKTGKYSVYVESLGHVKPGSGRTGTLGVIVNAEDAEAL